MTITIHSTDKIVHLNGIQARVWEGTSESGVHIHCLITCVAIDKNEPRSEEFKRELQEHKAPSPEVQAIPLRMVL